MIYTGEVKINMYDRKSIIRITGEIRIYIPVQQQNHFIQKLVFRMIFNIFVMKLRNFAFISLKGKSLTNTVLCILPMSLFVVFSVTGSAQNTDRVDFQSPGDQLLGAGEMSYSFLLFNMNSHSGERC